MEIPEEERQPACVLTCPAHARMFGDFDDPESPVSRAVRERGGYQLMPELNYNPSNHYLPPRVHAPIDTERMRQKGLRAVKDWIHRAVER
jgi:Fe-S-cluster-containing dehydrogenase component